MRCPVCYTDMVYAMPTSSGLHCPNCRHLWIIVDGQPVAPNGRPPGTGPLSAADVLPLVEQEVD